VGKIAKNVFRVIAEILVVLIIMVCTFLVFNNSSIQLVIQNILILAVLIRYIFPWINNIENKNLRMSKSENEKDLFIWADTISGAENYLNFIFKDKKSSNIMTNLISIKASLLDSVHEDLEQLRMLRALFKSYRENKTELVYFKAVGAAIISFMVFILQASVLGNIKNKTVHDFMNFENSWGLILSILFVAIYFILLPHKGENRVNLICNILDECIEELKSKKVT